MSNNKVEATYHPDDKPKPVQHMEPSDAPAPHAHMDEH